MTRYILLIALGVLTIYGIRFFRVKSKFEKIGILADEWAEKLRLEGADKYYEGFETSNLLEEYKMLLGKLDLNNKNPSIIAEIGCRTKIIEDILVQRGVEIPEQI